MGEHADDIVDAFMDSGEPWGMELLGRRRPEYKPAGKGRWTDKDGDTHLLVQMEHNHLLNTYRLCKRIGLHSKATEINSEMQRRNAL